VVAAQKDDKEKIMSATSKFDVDQEINDRIVAAIETAGEVRLPVLTLPRLSLATCGHTAQRFSQTDNRLSD
jgi:hypothetical protein